MNVLRCCLREMFCQGSTSLFASSADVPAVWKHALLACQSFEDLSSAGLLGKVSTPPGSSILVPAGSMKLIPALCRQGLCPLISSVLIRP